MDWRAAYACIGRTVEFETWPFCERVYKMNDDKSVPEKGKAEVLTVHRPGLLTMSLIVLRMDNGEVGCIPAEYMAGMTMT